MTIDGSDDNSDVLIALNAVSFLLDCDSFVRDDTIIDSRSGALGVKSREKEIRRSRALEVEKAKLVPEIAQSVFNAIVLAAVYLLAVEIYQLPPYIISSY